jgi:hypothetical protein
MGQPASVRVIERAYGCFPLKLAWAGQIIEIDAIDQCWTEMRGSSGKARYHFKVRCGPALYHLSEDTGSGLGSILQREDVL